jgi:hypothetical protein
VQDKCALCRAQRVASGDRVRRVANMVRRAQVAAGSVRLEGDVAEPLEMPVRRHGQQGAEEAR